MVDASMKTITDSFLMMPNKTVSTLPFETGDDFRGCQLRHRAGIADLAACRLASSSGTGSRATTRGRPTWPGI